MPQDRLQCPPHACLHSTALGCTQLSCSKLRFILPTLLTQRLPAPQTPIKCQNPEYGCLPLQTPHIFPALSLPHLALPAQGGHGFPTRAMCGGIPRQDSCSTRVAISTGKPPRGTRVPAQAGHGSPGQPVTAHASTGTARPGTLPSAHLQGRCLDRKQLQHRIVNCAIALCWHLPCCVSTVPPTPGSHVPPCLSVPTAKGAPDPPRSLPPGQCSSLEHPEGCSCTQESAPSTPTQTAPGVSWHQSQEDPRALVHARKPPGCVSTQCGSGRSYGAARPPTWKASRKPSCAGLGPLGAGTERCEMASR